MSDPGRVRVLMALRDQELCVCQIIDLIGLAPSTVSKHMTILRQAGLVESRKEGRWIYYRLPGDDASVPARNALRWATKSLRGAPEIMEDDKQLRKILKVNPEELCRIHEKR